MACTLGGAREQLALLPQVRDAWHSTNHARKPSTFSQELLTNKCL